MIRAKRNNSQNRHHAAISRVVSGLIVMLLAEGELWKTCVMRVSERFSKLYVHNKIYVHEAIIIQKFVEIWLRLRVKENYSGKTCDDECFFRANR